LVLYLIYKCTTGKNIDYLADDSKYKDTLIAYFSELIRDNNDTKKDFYDIYIYWKVVNDNWKK
jgi:hypothetical protein